MFRRMPPARVANFAKAAKADPLHSSAYLARRLPPTQPNGTHPRPTPPLTHPPTHPIPPSHRRRGHSLNGVVFMLVQGCCAQVNGASTESKSVLDMLSGLEQISITALRRRGPTKRVTSSDSSVRADPALLALSATCVFYLSISSLALTSSFPQHPVHPYHTTPDNFCAPQTYHPSFRATDHYHPSFRATDQSDAFLDLPLFLVCS